MSHPGLSQVSMRVPHGQSHQPGSGLHQMRSGRANTTTSKRSEPAVPCCFCGVPGLRPSEGCCDGTTLLVAMVKAVEAAEAEVEAVETAVVMMRPPVAAGPTIVQERPIALAVRGNTLALWGAGATPLCARWPGVE